VIGYYVHHHGRGHVNRMRSVVEKLRTPCTVLSSLPPEDDVDVGWVHLPRDDDDHDPEDVTARGRLHWVPRHGAGLAARSAQVATWIAEQRPELVVVDVSVEVALLSRLCGVPVVVVAMPGRRDDPAHALAYDIADAVLAPWPPGRRTDWPAAWLAKTTFLGSISRFDGWSRTVRSVTPTGRHGLLLWGSGGNDSAEEVLTSLRAGAPHWRWTLAGAGGQRLDPTATWDALCRAEVVVTHGGQNAVAEVAAARQRAVVIADERPFDEQRATVDWLQDAGLAATAYGCPEPGEWPRLLQRARAVDPTRWSGWSSGHGARTAALALDDLAKELGGRDR
jgi:hypothetical protein